MAEATDYLRLSGVTKQFGPVVANKDVSLGVARGEIHGLLGENGAGKSTLMKIVAGLVAPDDGTIEVGGVTLPGGNPLAARRAGVGMVHQDFMLVPAMSVAENVALSKQWHRLPIAGLKTVRNAIREASQRFSLAVDPDARIEDLPLGARQRVEILRLLLLGADVLIFDEPTAVLTPQEWQELAQSMRGLAGEGKALVFITHKLEELLSVTTRCTVMRGGEVVGTVPTAGMKKETLAQMMVGRDVVLRAPRLESKVGEPVLRVRDLESAGSRPLRRISFDVHAGEIFGIAGVDGNGQDELVAALTGLLPLTAGSVELCGTRLAKWGPRQFAALGGAAVYADRHQDAVALEAPVAENLVMGLLSRRETTRAIARFGWLRQQAISTYCEWLRGQYDIRLSGIEVPLRQLSGGNQQKVVLARELARSPTFLIAAQPTRGLDVAAIEFVYSKLAEHKRGGGATLLISTELDEILELADRVAVMYDGAFLDVLRHEEATLTALGRLLGGHFVSRDGEAA